MRPQRWVSADLSPIAGTSISVTRGDLSDARETGIAPRLRKNIDERRV